ncbi:MAG: PIN domain-containing protein [Candidatus Bathyarchaeia archaeon]
MRSGANKPRIVLDTKPLIKFFAKEEGWKTVQRILASVENGEIDAAISVVTLTEIYYKYLQEKRADLARIRIEELRYAVDIRKLSISGEVAVKAGEFKEKYNVPIADAFIAATAYFEDATLISDDADFKRIDEIKTLTEEEFLSSLG